MIKVLATVSSKKFCDFWTVKPVGCGNLVASVNKLSLSNDRKVYSNVYWPTFKTVTFNGT